MTWMLPILNVCIEDLTCKAKGELASIMSSNGIFGAWAIRRANCASVIPDGMIKRDTGTFCEDDGLLIGLNKNAAFIPLLASMVSRRGAVFGLFPRGEKKLYLV